MTAAGPRARRRPEINRFSGKVAQASRLWPLKQTKEKRRISRKDSMRRQDSFVLYIIQRNAQSHEVLQKTKEPANEQGNWIGSWRQAKRCSGF